MVLRKITIDNSVRCVRRSEQTKESKPNKIKNISGADKSNARKNNSNSRKQDKRISRNSKKIS